MTPHPSSCLRSLFEHAVNAAAPHTSLAGHWPALPAGRLVALAAGKAAAAMADAARAHYGNRIEGLVILPDGHRGNFMPGPNFRLMEGSHPVPDARSVRAADAALGLARGMEPGDLLLVLLSGGGSSVMCKPRPGVRLQDKRALTAALHRSGAMIAEINCVRTHLSSVKGGRLAAAARSPIVTLAISDVPGNDPRLIASGPTLSANSTPADALAVLSRYAIDPPDAVREVLGRADEEGAAPSARPVDPFTIVASGATMLAEAARLLAVAGFRIIDLGDAVQGDARALAVEHADMARRFAAAGDKCCILSGGETTVELKSGTGRGGRNTEYLLALALALDGAPGIWAFAGDSDGIDGHGGHAGALATPDTLSRARQRGMAARAHLDAHDSATFFEALGDLVVTGPTLTNVNDFRVILVDPGGR